MSTGAWEPWRAPMHMHTYIIIWRESHSSSSSSSSVVQSLSTWARSADTYPRARIWTDIIHRGPTAWRAKYIYVRAGGMMPEREMGPLWSRESTRRLEITPRHVTRTTPQMTTTLGRLLLHYVWRHEMILSKLGCKWNLIRDLSNSFHPISIWDILFPNFVRSG